MPEAEYKFAVVLSGHGRTPEEAWKQAVKELSRNTEKSFPGQWVIENDEDEDDGFDPVLAVAKG